MKKTILLSTLFLGFIAQSFAQDAPKDTTYWKKSTQFGANFNQASFSNWTAGGKASVGLNFFLNAKGEYTKDKTIWTNDLQTQFGFQSIGGDFRKTVDRLFFDSKIAHVLSKNWNWFGKLNLQTQFTQGFDYQVEQGGTKRDYRTSDLFAPAFITEAIGIEYKPNKNFSMQFAPLSMRQTIVSSDVLFAKTAAGYVQNVTRYGVAPGSSFLNEFGLMNIVTSYDKDIATNVNLKLRHEIFIKYANIGAMDNRIDVKLTAKINQYFSATFDTSVLYFEAQSTNIQVAQNFGIGFLYTMTNAKK